MSLRCRSNVLPRVLGFYLAFCLLLQSAMFGVHPIDYQVVGTWYQYAPDPFKTAVPVYGQIIQLPSSLSPKRDCGPKRINSVLLFVGLLSPTNKHPRRVRQVCAVMACLICPKKKVLCLTPVALCSAGLTLPRAIGYCRRIIFCTSSGHSLLSASLLLPCLDTPR